MGTYRADGYSAQVEGFFVFDGTKVRLAKTNASTFVVAEPCEVAPGTSGSLQVIVDGQTNSRLVRLPDGIAKGQTQVNYTVEAPF